MKFFNRMVRLAEGSVLVTPHLESTVFETKFFLAHAKSNHSPGMALPPVILREENTSDCVA